MKKLNFLMALGLLTTSFSANAQTTIASVGFEPTDSKYTTPYAYTEGGTYGDWVNPKDDDVWSEESSEAHSGEYSMEVANGSYVGNTWDRGFKIGNLKLKDNTSYRISFWVKVNEMTYLNDDGTESASKIKSSLSIGREYCDMPISTKSGLQYYYNYTSGLKDEWQRISYVTYFTNKADQDNFSTNYTGKEDINGNIPVAQGDPFPEDYFVIINMYSPVTYYLDDIKVEEDVTFNTATFSGKVIKLDFGYPTNTADLATAANGSLVLDPSCATVTVNGQAVQVDYVEGKTDGYVYIFLANDLAETDQVTVDFTVPADCPIQYNNDKRPSADVETAMTILGFKGETAYYDEAVNALPSVWAAAQVVSTDPLDQSFELQNLKTISITFDKELQLTENTFATLKYSDNFGDQEEDYSDQLSLSADKKTININVEGIADGEYTMLLSNVENIYGIARTTDVEYSFATGKDIDDTPSTTVFATDFDNQMTGGVPQGWYTYNSAGVHEYGFNDEDRTSQYNYNWGGTPGGGGTRLYEGFSGDFKKALYWGTRDTEEGYATYGQLVKDYLQSDGTLSADCPEGIALKLEPRKYQISFLMAAWKNEPTFTFTLENLQGGDPVAKFENILAAPNVNGSTGKVTGSVKCQADFRVYKEGYYVLKFTSYPAVWQEFLLANVKLITMPSKGVYYRQLLTEALAKVEETYANAQGEDYNCDTKTEFFEVYNSAKNDEFHSGEAVEAVIEKLTTLGTAMATRVDNVDNYMYGLLLAEDNLANLDTKYRNTDMANELAAYVEKYNAISPNTLDDATLAEVSTNLINMSSKIANIESIVDILTFGAKKASQTAQAFGVDSTPLDELSTDDRAVITSVNALNTEALYKKIINKEDLSEYMVKIYDDQHYNGDSELDDPNYSEDGYPLLVTGIDLTGYIRNPNMYTYMTSTSESLKDNSITGWHCEQGTVTDTLGNVTQVGSVHITGTAATASKPVSDVTLNAYGTGCDYKFYQEIWNLPVGVYDVYIACRTGQNSYIPEGEESSITVDYNGQNDETGEWDKYIFAQPGEDAMQVTPFVGGSMGTHACVIKNVTVKEGQPLTIGAIEHYVSGKAQKNGEAYDFWDTNTYVDNARIYFVSPLEGYDYANALASGIKTVSDSQSSDVSSIYTVAGTKVSNLQKGINIIKMSNGSVRKVLVK